MRKLFFILLLSSFGYTQQPDTLFILQTTDVHGTIYPYDYFTDQPANNRGLAKIYTLVKEYRLKHKNVILVDAGDLLQGTPLTYYFKNHDLDHPNPMILTMNYMGYDAFTVGNHDIEQGVFTYLRARNESYFPWLSANAVLQDGRLFFKPYTFITKGGLKVALLGLTTPSIPMWLDKSLYPGITWEDMVTTAKKFASQLRPRADLLVGVFHAGFDESYGAKQSEVAGLPIENASGIIAREITSFDAVLAGHSHKPFPKPGQDNVQNFDDSVLKMNAGSQGRNLGVARFIFDTASKKILHKDAWLEAVDDVQAAPEILELDTWYHQKVLDYIRKEIGTTKAPLSAEKARFEDTPLIELIQDAQLDYSGADISFAASFSDRFNLPAGPIRIKDAYGMYRYENTLYVLEMTGQQIKDFLEYSSRYFLWDNGQIKINHEVAGFNYDMAEGVNYDIDVSKPVGNRIKNLIYTKTGKPLEMDNIYKVALNSYRAQGGGGHIKAAGAENAKIISKSGEEVRNILVDYISKQKTVNGKCNHNWYLLPEK